MTNKIRPVNEIDKMVYSYCPKCRNPLHRAGKIKVMGPYGRYILIHVYYCRICGWRGI